MTSPSRDARPSVPPSRLTHSRRATDRLRQLAFLQEFAQLATQARDWDELMRTLVDRTTAAMGVEVCSFYLLDRTGQPVAVFESAIEPEDRQVTSQIDKLLGTR